MGFEMIKYISSERKSHNKGMIHGYLPVSAMKQVFARVRADITSSGTDVTRQDRQI
jgi:hypothetical protein